MFQSTLAPKWPIMVPQCGIDHQKSTILLIFGMPSELRLWRTGMLLLTKSKGQQSNVHCQWTCRYLLFSAIKLYYNGFIDNGILLHIRVRIVLKKGQSRKKHFRKIPIRESCLKVCFIFIAKVEPLRFSNSFLFLSKFMTTIYARLLLLSGVA